MTPRNEHQNRQLKEERQEQILHAALKVFFRRGLIATKISDIAKEVGLSHGLVYHYFNSKDEIFTTLVKRALEGSTHVVDLTAQRTIPANSRTCSGCWRRKLWRANSIGTGRKPTSLSVCWT